MTAFKGNPKIDGSKSSLPESGSVVSSQISRHSKADTSVGSKSKADTDDLPLSKVITSRKKAAGIKLDKTKDDTSASDTKSIMQTNIADESSVTSRSFSSTDDLPLHEVIGRKKSSAVVNFESSDENYSVKNDNKAMGIATISDTAQKSGSGPLVGMSITQQNDKSAENAADQQITTTASDVATSTVAPPKDNFWQSHWTDSFTSKLKNITKMNPEELNLLSMRPQDPDDDIFEDPNAIPNLKDDTEAVKHLKKPPVDNTSRSIKVSKDKTTGGKQLSRKKKNATTY